MEIKIFDRAENEYTLEVTGVFDKDERFIGYRVHSAIPSTLSPIEVEHVINENEEDLFEEWSESQLEKSQGMEFYHYN